MSSFWVYLVGILANFAVATVLSGTNWGQTERGKRTIILSHLVVLLGIIWMSAWLP